MFALAILKNPDKYSIGEGTKNFTNKNIGNWKQTARVKVEAGLTEKA